MERKPSSVYPQELLDLFHEYQRGDELLRRLLRRGVVNSVLLAVNEVAAEVGRRARLPVNRVAGAAMPGFGGRLTPARE
jgi:hypothetical protein